MLPVQNPTMPHVMVGWGGKSSYMPLNVRQWSPTFFKTLLSPTSDQNEFPPNITHTLSRDKIFAKGKISIKGYFAECRTPMLNDS